MNSPSKQSGAALLVILALVVAVFTVVATSSISLNGLRLNASNKTNASLTEARSALFGYFLKNTPIGTLPCPDANGDGFADSSGSDCDALLGLFPYKTVGTPLLKDGYSSPLWYAVEARYTANNAALKNPSTLSDLTLDDQTVSAIVIAANKALDNQERSAQFDLPNFLEGANADNDYTQFERPASALGNDTLIPIETELHWRMASQSMLEIISTTLLAYHNNCGEFPWAADNMGAPYNSVNLQTSGTVPFDSALPANWGTGCASTLSTELWWRQHWGQELFYAMCESSNGQCLQIDGDTQQFSDAILLSPGVRITGQTRPSSNLDNYFEGQNSDGSSPFEYLATNNHDENFNDVIYVVR